MKNAVSSLFVAAAMLQAPAAAADSLPTYQCVDGVGVPSFAQRVELSRRTLSLRLSQEPDNTLRVTAPKEVVYPDGLGNIEVLPNRLYMFGSEIYPGVGRISTNFITKTDVLLQPNKSYTIGAHPAYQPVGTPWVAVSGERRYATTLKLPGASAHPPLKEDFVRGFVSGNWYGPRDPTTKEPIAVTIREIGIAPAPATFRVRERFYYRGSWFTEYHSGTRVECQAIQYAYAGPRFSCSLDVPKMPEGKDSVFDVRLVRRADSYMGSGVDCRVASYILAPDGTAIFDQRPRIEVDAGVIGY